MIANINTINIQAFNYQGVTSLYIHQYVLFYYVNYMIEHLLAIKNNCTQKHINSFMTKEHFVLAITTKHDY